MVGDPGTSTVLDFSSPLPFFLDITDNMAINAFSLLALFAGLLPLASAQNNSATYTNPVLNKVGADPFVLRDDGYYYMTYTTATNITILKSTSLTDWDNAEVKLAFDPPV